MGSDEEEGEKQSGEGVRKWEKEEDGEVEEKQERGGVTRRREGTMHLEKWILDP